MHYLLDEIIMGGMVLETNVQVRLPTLAHATLAVGGPCYRARRRPVYSTRTPTLPVVLARRTYAAHAMLRYLAHASPGFATIVCLAVFVV